MATNCGRFQKCWPIAILLVLILITSRCTRDPEGDPFTDSSYIGTYPNIRFTENLIKEFSPGIYYESEIPDDIKNLTFGRVEIDFRYNGNGATYFSPLFYYGSINKNNADNAVEAPQYHLAVEIGHYNVIPMAVDYLFYTICTNNYPQYCRDTNFPVIAGVDYTVVFDKRPEGIVLQLKSGNKIVNAFTHAFFPDSVQMFFRDVTAYTLKNRGDSLQQVLMVGKGFAGIEKGLHELNGELKSLRIYKYTVSAANADYELQGVRNQLAENERITYRLKDNSSDANAYVQWKYEFRPYTFREGELQSAGDQRSGVSKIVKNSQIQSYILRAGNVGHYKLYPQTVDETGNVLKSSSQAFDIWVYPKEWSFEYYK